VIVSSSDDRNLFNSILPNIADPKVSRFAIKCEAPRFAETKGPNFGSRLGIAPEGVICRNRVGQSSFLSIDIQAVGQ